MRPIEEREAYATDPTPTTEAGRAYLAVPGHEDDAPRHVDDYEASWFIRGYEAAAQARAGGLDVEVLARAIHHAHKPDPIDIEGARQVAARYRAILAGDKP